MRGTTMTKIISNQTNHRTVDARNSTRRKKSRRQKSIGNARGAEFTSTDVHHHRSVSFAARGCHYGCTHDDPDMRRCKSIKELTQIAYKHKDSISPRGMSAFWSIMSKYHTKQYGVSQGGDVVNERTQMQLDQLIDKTLRGIEQYIERDLSTVAISLAKIMKKVEANGHMQEDSLRQMLHRLLIGNNSMIKMSIFNKLAAASVPVLNEFDPRSLSDLIYAFGLARVIIPVDGRHTFFDVLAEVAISKLNRCIPRDLSNIVWAYATARVSHPKLFKAIADHIVTHDNLNRFIPQTFAIIAWAYATARVSHPKLFKAIADHVVTHDNLSRFIPQDFSNIVWAYATARVSHPKLFKAIVEHIVIHDNLNRFNPHDYANIVWAYATARVSHPKLFKAIADHIVTHDNLSRFIPQEYANIVWAYATARVSHPKLFRTMAEHIVTQENLNRFIPQDFSNIVWAYATARVSHPKLFRTMAEHIITQEWNRFNPQEYANIAWAYAVANVTNSAVFGDIFIEACVKRKGEFKLKGLSQLHQWQLWQDELQSGIQFPQSLQKMCYEAFISGDPTPSKLQDGVVSELVSIGLQLEEEVLTKSGYRLDVVVEVNGKKVGVEVDGPFHFIGREPNGNTKIKHRQVTNLDSMPLVSVPYWEWDKFKKDSQKKQQYLCTLLGINRK